MTSNQPKSLTRQRGPRLGTTRAPRDVPVSSVVAGAVAAGTVIGSQRFRRTHRETDQSNYLLPRACAVRPAETRPRLLASPGQPRDPGQALSQLPRVSAPSPQRCHGPAKPPCLSAKWPGEPRLARWDWPVAGDLDGQVESGRATRSSRRASTSTSDARSAAQGAYGPACAITGRLWSSYKMLGLCCFVDLPRSSLVQLVSFIRRAGPGGLSRVFPALSLCVLLLC